MSSSNQALPAQKQLPRLDSNRADGVLVKQGKARLDAFLVQQHPDLSRAKIQEAIKNGQVTVNSQAQLKTSSVVRQGDTVSLTLPPPAQLRADPEVCNQPASSCTHACDRSS